MHSIIIDRNIITIRFLFKEKKMEAEKIQSMFVHWLDTALADEQWRAIISAKIRQHELPVINLDGEDRFIHPRLSGHGRV